MLQLNKQLKAKSFPASALVRSIPTDATNLSLHALPTKPRFTRTLERKFTAPSMHLRCGLLGPRFGL